MGKTTRKATKVIGKEKYINQRTGEIQEMQVIEVEERDANFDKIWLSHIIASLDLIGNQKMRLALWLIDQRNKENMIIMTIRAMEKATGISQPTIIATLKVLVASDFLRVVQRGVYQINPDMIWKGGSTNRLNVLIEYKYKKAKQQEDSNGEKPLPEQLSFDSQLEEPADN